LAPRSRHGRPAPSRRGRSCPAACSLLYATARRPERRSSRLLRGGLAEHLCRRGDRGRSRERPAPRALALAVRAPPALGGSATEPGTAGRGGRNLPTQPRPAFVHPPDTGSVRGRERGADNPRTAPFEFAQIWVVASPSCGRVSWSSVSWSPCGWASSPTRATPRARPLRACVHCRTRLRGLVHLQPQRRGRPDRLPALSRPLARPQLRREHDDERILHVDLARERVPQRTSSLPAGHLVASPAYTRPDTPHSPRP